MNDHPPSAWQLAQELGDALPDPAAIPTEAFALTDAARDLVAAVVATDLEPAERGRLAGELTAITAQLRSLTRQPVINLGRHPDGRIENLSQAGSGRLNPHAPELVFDAIEPPDTTDGPVVVEIVARCVLTEAHGGPPERAHGGVVATLLDETIGVAATAAGASGMTGGITIRYRAGTPLHTPLVVRARYVDTDGRKHHATGEIRAGDTPTAEAEGLYIASAR
ncbi:MAG: PaaI family thioesterase [Acidimicrobiales bacterium]